VFLKIKLNKDMKHYPNTVQNDQEEINRFVQEMKMANLITSADSSFESTETGVFNPVFLDGKYYLHLNRTDDQYKALKQNNKAHLVYFDFLCNIPSYWIDKEDGGVATSYYRHLDLTCECKIFEDLESLATILPKFLKVFQSEGGYRPIFKEEELYQSDFKVLGIVELTPIAHKCKFKLGQNRDIEKRLEIVQKLKERGEMGDLKAAHEIELWIKKYNK
jgi:predicted FMN-binding regulatory protein PaiB